MRKVGTPGGPASSGLGLGEPLSGPPGGVPPMPAELPPELVELNRQMEELQKADPEGFEAMMAASMATAQAGGDPEAALAGLQKAVQNMHAEQLGSGGLELPGDRTLGADGDIKKKETGIDITPTPGFVVKTKRVDVAEPTAGSSNKVFINVCSHEGVGKPATQKRLDDQGNEVEGLNVPVSLGPPRPCTDKKGDAAIVYDCVVNPEVIAEAETDTSGTHRNFLCQLAMQHCESKFKCELDKRYKLPKIDYYGEAASQRIRDRSKTPQIQEVSSSSTPSKPGKRAGNAGGSKAGRARGKAPALREVVPEDKPLMHTVRCAHTDPVTGEEVWDDIDGEALGEPRVVRTDRPSDPLPHAMTLTAGPICRHGLEAGIDSMALDVGPYGLTLKVLGHTPLSVTLPFAVEMGANGPPPSAELDPHQGQLVVQCSVDRTAHHDDADPGSRPWLLRHALEGEDATRRDHTAEDDRTNADPVDRYHLNASAQVNPYTGLRSRGVEDPVQEDEELPEDRFHRYDALSTHYISQREGDKADKHKRAAEERQRRKTEEQDENVEYIDTEDFEPGGKYGPPAIDVAARRDELCGVQYTTSEDMQKAAQIVASAVQKQAAHDSPATSPTAASTAAAATGEGGATGPAAVGLKSTVWSELLD